LSYWAYSDTRVDHKIAVIVNEKLITSYDIIQRMKLISLLQGVNINEQNNQLLLNNTVDELINEKLKKEKIDEYEIMIKEEEYKEFEEDFFKRSNFKRTTLKNLLEMNNINYEELKILLEHELSWNKLVRGLYLRIVSVSNTEINEILSKNPNMKTEQARKLIMQRQLDLKSSKLLRDMLNEATIEYK
tara:strand:- start:712 stop:1275 length:564 start_codon:yes stop_codon:yes gene_type:complete